MTEATLPIQVPSEDPKKKDQGKADDKAKLNGDAKEGEDLVSPI